MSIWDTIRLGPFINYVDKQGGGGLAKCQAKCQAKGQAKCQAYEVNLEEGECQNPVNLVYGCPKVWKNFAIKSKTLIGFSPWLTSVIFVNDVIPFNRWIHTLKKSFAKVNSFNVWKLHIFNN